VVLGVSLDGRTPRRRSRRSTNFPFTAVRPTPDQRSSMRSAVKVKSMLVMGSFQASRGLPDQGTGNRLGRLQRENLKQPEDVLKSLPARAVDQRGPFALEPLEIVVGCRGRDEEPSDRLGPCPAMIDQGSRSVSSVGQGPATSL